MELPGRRGRYRNISYNDHIKTPSNDALPSKDMASEGAVGNLS